MPAVYKILSPKYIDAFITGKAIRIGTLYDYRKTEKHSTGIADSLEGKATSSIKSTENLEGYERALFHQDIKNLGFIHGQNININMKNCSITINNPDCYVFSSCLEKPDLSRFKTTLHSNDDYNCIVRINDIARLAAMLASALARGSVSTGRYIGAPVSYNPQNWDYLKSGMKQPNPFEKDAKFKAQDEYRIIFEPKMKNIKPVLVDLAPFPPELMERLI